MTTITITNGQVIDVESGEIAERDVHVADGLVVDAVDAPAAMRIDARRAFVAPGFIDLHTHVFSHPLFETSRLEADRIGIEQGVACVVDAGSSGAATIDAFPRFVHETQATPTYAFVNIGSPGLPNVGGGHASRPDLCDLPGTVAALERHDWLVGVKVLASASHTGSFGLEAVKLARKAAELSGRPLMLHVGNPPPLIDDVLDLLRPGDIVTHTYHGKVGGVLGYRDAVIPAFRDAVARGVVVDIGHGRSSFSFRVCEAALDQGMPVHTISSDLHRGNVDRYAVSLARTMTKLALLGVPFLEVVRAVTKRPAETVGLDRLGFGRIAAGHPAYLTVFDLVDGAFEVEDATGESRTASRWFETRGVVVRDTYHERTRTL
ncbi:MAG: amidohydrolase/deacetylase family metallohydrolase [Gammaproteobacteria bacterium]|nr:amidohydrolase/deacetylase family metallohydrolase [Gammaproteobacteria bacterium]MYE80677.1 amidohydrolase/deacetylase family metallohydrolase [Gammaproteobacteria bacterium]